MGAKMIDFGGWDMPVQYSGLIEEHRAVREHAGLFDVSHMGEIEIRGRDALALVNFVTSNDASTLEDGQAQYSALLNDHGGFVDDILVHKISGDHFFLCVNAANQEGDYRHIETNNRFEAAVEDAGGRYAQLALQGPRAPETLQKLTRMELAAIRYYHFVDGELSGIPARIARTGYTGEDGFEVYLPPNEAERLWDEILAAGVEFGIKPCGLGARNTLRLEASLPLYGHEIDANVTPWEAGLDWIVKLGKRDFIGREALIAQKERGIPSKLIGFEMTGRGIARDGYEVYADGKLAGRVTSGGPSPTLNKNIGFCYLPAVVAQTGREIHITVRGVPVPAITVRTPFFNRHKARSK